MKGFLRRRGDAWELRVVLGTDLVTGKQRYASRTVRGGKREAQRMLNEMVTEADRGLSVRTNATAGELIEAWFEHAAADFSPKTVKETRGFIDRNLLPAMGAVPLSKLKASDLDRFYRRLPATGRSATAGSRRPLFAASTASSAERSVRGSSGLARRQPCCGDDTTARPAVGDRATLRSGPRSRAGGHLAEVSLDGRGPEQRLRHRLSGGPATGSSCRSPPRVRRVGRGRGAR